MKIHFLQKASNEKKDNARMFMSQLKPVSLYRLLSRDLKALGKESISYFIKEKRGSIPEIVREWSRNEAKQIILSIIVNLITEDVLFAI